MSYHVHCALAEAVTITVTAKKLQIAEGGYFYQEKVLTDINFELVNSLTELICTNSKVPLAIGQVQLALLQSTSGKLEFRQTTTKKRPRAMISKVWQALANEQS